MKPNDRPALLVHPQWGWSLDLSTAPTPNGLPLNWTEVFKDMRDLEEGAIANTTEKRQVGHFWLRAPELAPTMGQATAIGETTAKILDWIRAVQGGDILLDGAHPVTDVIHIGVGGSALGPQLLVSALRTPEGLTVHFLDNLDPRSVHDLIDHLKDCLESTLLIVSSKSGNTVETRQLTQEVFRLFQQAGHKPAARAVAITQPGSALSEKAQTEKWLGTFPIWEWVGGRFSCTSAVGLLTAGLAGADITSILLGAREMDQWTRQEDPALNPAARIAALWYSLGQGKGNRNWVVIPYSDRLALLGKALQQVFMESLGKGRTRKGEVTQQGVTVYGNKGSSDQHALMQQLVEGRDDALVCLVQVLNEQDQPHPHTLQMGDTLQHFLLGTRKALWERDRPVVTWTLPCLNGTALGATIALFERAVSFYASLVDINAYDQPGVEAGKRGAAHFHEVQLRVLDAISRRSLTLHHINQLVEADPIEIQHVLNRLVATHRVSRTTKDAEYEYRRTP